MEASETTGQPVATPAPPPVEVVDATSETAPASAPAAAPAGYEFSAGQNETMRSLGDSMGWVGIVGILGGLFVIAIAIRQLLHGRYDWPILLVQGALNLLIGFWTRSASAQFSQVAGTTGADVAHLMAALGELRRIYRLQKILIIAAIVVMAVAAIFVVVSSTSRG